MELHSGAPDRSIVDVKVLAVGAEFITVQSGTERPMTFPTSETLRAGRVVAQPSPTALHKLNLVKMGDKVTIYVGQTAGTEVCTQIGIHRRPGGKVPPAEDPPGATIRFHERMNALQDFEERGIPLPPRLDPEFPRWQFQQGGKAYIEFVRKRDHTAPPPRPVIRK